MATSGDYRHWVEVQGRRLSHTMDPRRGTPVLDAPASVTVLAPSCAAADAWATAPTVLGPGKGGILARQVGIDALFLLRGKEDSILPCRVGRIFWDQPATGKPPIECMKRFKCRPVNPGDAREALLHGGKIKDAEEVGDFEGDGFHARASVRSPMVDIMPVAMW